MQHLRLRVMRDSDLPAVTALNAAASPALNLLSEDEMRELTTMCDVRLVATGARREVVAFLLSLGMGQAYASENYRWFEERGVRHQYIDRIVVSPTAKGTGVGRALYESVFERARERGAAEVTTEVFLDPPNPGSVAFHEHLGFRHLGEQRIREGSVLVALLARTVF
ncbi:GNAT family N-acetyltransferase [Demequina sp. SYSU T00039]|uniref:GNAT family N-acetyltransferase n=1 Tax=Demequina lignilytica TaxID=3051663 RepID=A0AAW7M7T7_9MICO|nr:MULTISPECIES: GNAT family N-acetyltransferase [unclassified Demequina]MDN4477027.1 GNAT family N-acetyltransferase [Demequina sp. SYSU T00039-1]MDN4487200.1 GNAT family N-acetyltransferase [Demequina sp. SYSU T00039]MDN4491805.1 GNAT family N-acetyltransferase [Demequina sp. SYSU T00068]